MKNTIITNGFLGVFILAFTALVVFSVILSSQPREAVASVAYGNDYNATTTSPAFNPLDGNNSKLIQLKSQQGSLGSVIITSAGTGGGAINFYDATTTIAAQRAASMSTTSILLASVPNGGTVGTYVFDIATKNGLVMVYEGGGTIATSTVTFR